MNGKVWWLLSFFCASFFAVPTFAQCTNQQDRPCWNLQYILYAAGSDFREFRGSTLLKLNDSKLTPPHPDLSVGAIHVPCHTDFWLSSEVAVYMCSAEVPAQEADDWYAKTMADLHELQYLWQFKGESAGTDHYVDAGPQGCELAQVRTTGYGSHHIEEPYIVTGPYLGQCPLHLQTVRRSDGTARISFWLNSSVNLAQNPAPASKTLELSASAPPPTPQQNSASVTASGPPLPTATPRPATPETLRPEPAVENSGARSSTSPAGCDDLCQGLKKVMENRASSFQQLRASSRSSVPSKTASLEDAVKLSGAGSCSINADPSAGARTSARNEMNPGAHFAPVSTADAKSVTSRAVGKPRAQYVCYWPQSSEAAAESEFHDLVGVLQTLIPSSWSAQQKSEADELSGAQITVWFARDSRNRAAIRMYLSGRSVGLHISAAQ